MIPETYQDDSLQAFFKSVAVRDPHASKAQGRPIYRDEVHCEIRIPGDRHYQPVVPAHSMWRRIEGEEVTYAMRFARQYNRFMEGQEQVADGTPLSELTFLTESKRQELRGLKIYTAEALAALEGSHLKSLGAIGNEMKTQAKEYLAAASGAGRAAEMAARIAALEAQLALRNEGVDDDEAAEKEEKRALKARYFELTKKNAQGNPSVETLRQMVQIAEEEKA